MEATEYNFNEFKKLSEENERLTSQVADQDEQLISKHNIIKALTKENERLKRWQDEATIVLNKWYLVSDFLASKNLVGLGDNYSEKCLEVLKALTEQVEKLKAELDQSEKNYLSAVVGRKDFREAFRKERTERHILESLLESEKTILSLRTKERDELVQELGKKSLTPYGEQLQEELSRLREERKHILDALNQRLYILSQSEDWSKFEYNFLQSLLEKFNDSKT